MYKIYDLRKMTIDEARAKYIQDNQILKDIGLLNIDDEFIGFMFDSFVLAGLKKCYDKANAFGDLKHDETK